MTTEERDPYELSSEEAKRMKEEDKSGIGGELCPKRNVAIKKTCHVCNRLQKIYSSYKKGDPEWNLANRKNAKPSYFLNVVFKENPSKSVLLEVFKHAGNTLMDKAEEGKWFDIAKPKAGEGRDVEISKKRGDSGYNEYPVEAVLEKADWSIDPVVYDNLPHFGKGLPIAQANMIKILEEGKIPILKVSSLKEDQSMTFRVARTPGEDWIVPVYRHWGNVTKAEIDGEVPVDLEFMTSPEQGREVAPWEDSDKPQDKSAEEPKPEDGEEKVEETSAKTPPCHGHAQFFEPENEECKACGAFKSCGREVLKKT